MANRGWQQPAAEAIDSRNVAVPFPTNPLYDRFVQLGVFLAIATMIFYNQVHGVSAALCGTVFLIASVIDAISDPLVGALSDSVNTRWGRRHPFMFLSALPPG